MRPYALSLLLAIATSAAHGQPTIEGCADAPLPTRCLLDLAHKESQRLTAPIARYQALAKLLNAAATSRLPLPDAEKSARAALAEARIDDANRLDLLIALHNYRRTEGARDDADRLAALALYLGMADSLQGSARLALMLTACGVLELPAELAAYWQPLLDHGCSPGFLDDTALPAETDRLMAVLLAPLVYFREDEGEAFEAAIDRAHATARDMDEQMEDKPEAPRAAWQQLKAGMYLLHGASFAAFGDPLRARLSAAAAYAAILAAEEIGGEILAEERATVSGLLMRAEQPGTAEQILDETTRLIDADSAHLRVPAGNRVGFLTALIELLAAETEPLFCPDPGEDPSRKPT